MGGWVVEVAVLMVGVVDELVLGVDTGEVSDDWRDDELAVGTVESSDVVGVGGWVIEVAVIVGVDELVFGVSTGEVSDNLAVGTVESWDVVCSKLSLSGVGGWVVKVAVLMVGVEELVFNAGIGEVSDDLAVGTVESSDVVAVTVVEISSTLFVSGDGVYGLDGSGGGAKSSGVEGGT